MNAKIKHCVIITKWYTISQLLFSNQVNDMVKLTLFFTIKVFLSVDHPSIFYTSMSVTVYFSVFFKLDFCVCERVCKYIIWSLLRQNGGVLSIQGLRPNVVSHLHLKEDKMGWDGKKTPPLTYPFISWMENNFILCLYWSAN